VVVDQATCIQSSTLGLRVRIPRWLRFLISPTPLSLSLAFLCFYRIFLGKMSEHLLITEYITHKNSKMLLCSGIQWLSIKLPAYRLRYFEHLDYGFESRGGYVSWFLPPPHALTLLQSCAFTGSSLGKLVSQG